MNPKDLTKAQRNEIARETPAGLAWVLSEGRWVCARHLEVLNRKLIDLAAGRIRRLAVFMPPRHGKSQLCSRYFPAWFLGTFPDSRVIQCGYGSAFAATWGRHARNAIDEACDLGVFASRVDPSKSSADEWEILKREGGMYAVGIGGGITGRGADLLTIDDACKSRAEAESLTYRERTWEWYTDDAYTRLHPGGRVLLVATRWHHDDLPGRILKQDEERGEWDVLCFPAIAEEADALERSPGEALWPERYPLTDLEDRRNTLGSYGFAALYQQRPAPREGGMFKRHWFRIVDAAPAEAERVRGWDLAGTSGDGDYTAGVRIARNGSFYVEDCTTEQLGPAGVRTLVRNTAEQDGRKVSVSVPQDPGQAGKAQAQEFTQLLSGFVVRATTESGSKALRAEAFAAQCEAGNVALVRGSWNDRFIDQFCEFKPDVTNQDDDIVDATSRAFDALTRRGAQALFGWGK